MRLNVTQVRKIELQYLIISRHGGIIYDNRGS